MSIINENGIITGPAEAGIREESRDARSVVFIGLLTVLAFSMGRIEMAATFFPCGIAFLSAALKRSSLNIYLVLPVLVGIATLWQKNRYIWGDTAAILVCAAVFLILARRSIPDFYRMILCISIIVICNVSYYTAAHILYRLDLRLLFLEAVVATGLYYVFHVFFSFTNLREDFRGSVEGGIVSLSAVFILLFCGLTVQNTFPLLDYIPQAAGFLCILLLGYKLGISAGIISSASVSILLYLCGIIPVSQMIIFLCAGLTAGFFRGLNKYTTAACFSAVCLIFGLTCTGAMGALPSLPPLFAAVCFLFLPNRLMKYINQMLRRLIQERGSYEAPVDDLRMGEVTTVLDGYKECFGSLAKLYNIGKDQRSIISHQFKGMQQVVNQLEMDLKEANRGKLAVLPSGADGRYSIDIGTSGYARSGAVSGDSYICKELSDGRYIIILSDGMGKGEAAAVESSLAVKTLANLIEAGFDIEIALRTLNSILLLKSEEEIFSTIDIGIFNRNSGRFKLYKVGAASTFVKRGDRVDTVKMAALPMGIVDGLKIDFVSLKLQPGDQIIMVSDGITDSVRYRSGGGDISEAGGDAAKNDGGKHGGYSRQGRGIKTENDSGCKWLCDTIRSIKSKDPSTMADLIINRAVENYGVHEKDDLTVISAVVKDVSFPCSNRA